MNQTQKYFCNMSLVLWAYGYGISTYSTAAIVFALGAIAMAIFTHSWGCVKKNLLCVFLGTLFLFGILYAGDLPRFFPTLPFLTLANVFVSALWMESSYRCTFTGMKVWMGMSAIAFLIALCMPAGMVFTDKALSLGQVLLFLLVVFLPSPVLFMKKYGNRSLFGPVKEAYTLHSHSRKIALK